MAAAPPVHELLGYVRQTTCLGDVRQGDGEDFLVAVRHLGG